MPHGKTNESGVETCCKRIRDAVVYTVIRPFTVAA